MHQPAFRLVQGAFPPLVPSQTLPASRRMPALPSCGDAELAIAPFGPVRPLRPWLVVNPGEARLRLGLHGCNRPAQTISPALRAFLARQIFCASRSSTLLRPLRDAARPYPRPRITDKAAMGATLQPERRFIMANIGTFTAEKDSFTGTVRTLTLNVKVKFVPNDKGESENAPDYRIRRRQLRNRRSVEESQQGGAALPVGTLDDPSFPATIYARLIEGEDGTHNLIWSRSKRRLTPPSAPRPLRRGAVSDRGIDAQGFGIAPCPACPRPALHW